MSGAHTPQTADEVAEAIGPTLDAFVASIAPTLNKVSEQLYEHLLYSVQDYLRDNAQWNLGAEIDRCRKIEHDNVQLRISNGALLSALEELLDGLPFAQTESEYELVQAGCDPTEARRLAAAFTAIAKAKGGAA